MTSAPGPTLSRRASDLISYVGAVLVFGFVLLMRLGSVSGPGGLGAGLLVAAAAWLLHFARRSAECLWVHRYSERRNPLGDALVEYAYYWGFGSWIAWSLSSHAGRGLDALALLGLGLFLLGELGNAWAHQKLRALRAPQSQERGLPSGGLFDWVSCANYSYEILSWLGFAVMTRSLAAGLFCGAGAAILAGWAKARHARYRELFDGREGRPLYPSQRRALVPFVWVTF